MNKMIMIIMVVAILAVAIVAVGYIVISAENDKTDFSDELPPESPDETLYTLTLYGTVLAHPNIGSPTRFEVPMPHSAELLAENGGGDDWWQFYSAALWTTAPIKLTVTVTIHGHSKMCEIYMKAIDMPLASTGVGEYIADFSGIPEHTLRPGDTVRVLYKVYEQSNGWILRTQQTHTISCVAG